MTSFGTLRISAKRADLTGLRLGCASSFDCHSLDMDLAQTSFHYRPANILEGKDMR
jgi:hypothetical protein